MPRPIMGVAEAVRLLEAALSDQQAARRAEERRDAAQRLLAEASGLTVKGYLQRTYGRPEERIA